MKTRLSYFAAVLTLSGCISDIPNDICPDQNLVCPTGSKCSATPPYMCIYDNCGDRVQQENEQCDPGGVYNTQFCNKDCTLPRCPDGKVNEAAGEECDDNNLDTDDDCVNCKNNYCGDGYPDTKGPKHFEVCDVGTAWNGKSDCPYGMEKCEGCNSDCTAPIAAKAHYCGDGNKDVGLLDKDGVEHTEDCDNGDRNGSSDCAYSVTEAECELCTSDCKHGLTIAAPHCGDGIKQENVLDEQGVKHIEACDVGSRNGNPDCPYGMTACEGCSGDCSTPITTTGHWCGDGTVDVNMRDDHGVAHTEACDNLKSQGCGTCVGCKRVVQTADATARFKANTISSTVLVVDNDSITLEDGEHKPAVTFTFHTTCGDDLTCIPIKVSRFSTTDDLASVINAVVTNPGAGHPISVTTKLEKSTITFTGVSIQSSAPDGAYTVAGNVLTASLLSVQDGDTITLNDNEHAAVTFEFNANGTCGTGHVCIASQKNNLGTAEDLANAVKDVVNKYQSDQAHSSTFSVTARCEEDASENCIPTSKDVTIFHNVHGHVGNDASISANVQKGAFSVEKKLSGGVGCWIGEPCNEDNDCKTANNKDHGKCTGTCQNQ